MHSMTHHIHNNRIHDQPAEIGIITTLHKRGLLNDRAHYLTMQKLRPASKWYNLAGNLLLFYGSALLLTGILYFFAYNWASMSKLEKFSVLEAGILLTALFSCLNRFSDITRKIWLMSASVLTGVLLAVFGQIYQTGADAYELFRGWALLISVYVLISEFCALWFLWILILNTWMILYVVQVIRPEDILEYNTLYMMLAGINVVFLLLKELLEARLLPWLQERWAGSLLLTMALIALNFPLTRFIFHDQAAPEFVVTLLFYAGLCTSGFLYYNFVKKEFLPICIIAADLVYLVLLYLNRFMYQLKLGEAVFFLLYGFVVIMLISVTAFFLKKMNQYMKQKGNLNE